MENDFLERMEYAGLTSRIKRLSDSLLYSTREFYKHQNLDIEPNWHMVILLLKERGSMTISEICQELQLSHPAVIKLTNKMKDKAYLCSRLDPGDGRKNLLSLSPKAEKEYPKLQECWDACVETMKELTRGKVLIFEVLKDMEEQLAEADYRTRTKNNMKRIN